jgi:hypothetical protein
MTEAGCLWPGLFNSRMQMSGGGAGCLRLRGQLLSLAKFRDSGGQRDELGHQRNGRQRGVAGQVPCEGNHPCGTPQLVTVVAAPGQPPVLGAGRTVVGIGRAAQVRVAQRPRRDVQRVGRRPRRIRRRSRISYGAMADMFRGCPGLARRVPVDLVPFRRRNRGAPERSALPPGARYQRPRSRGRVSPAASRPPPYQAGVPSGPVWPGSVTEYPVTCPGSISLNRTRTSTPASPKRAKNPVSSFACPPRG